MVLLLFLILFTFIGFGVSIWLSMGISGMIFILLRGEVSLRVFASQMIAGIDSTTLIAIPLFILAGNLMNTTGITTRLTRFADFFVGGFRAGLAYVSIVVSVIMAGVSGSAVADASSVSAVLHPIMKERGYDDGYAAAINTSSAIIGPIIPPSVPMIFMGVISGISIGHLFVGGIIPGLLMAVFLWGLSTIQAHRRGYPRVTQVRNLRAFFRLLSETFLAVLAPVFVISGVVFGFVTLVEVAVLTNVYILLLSLLVYRSVTVAGVWRVFRQTAVFSASIMAIFAVVGMYQYIVASEQLDSAVMNLVTALNLGRNGFLLVTLVFFLLMGCILDAIPVMLIFFPVLLPIAISLGIDPTHFGVITVLNLMIGLMTPPIGALLFVQTKISGMPFGELVRALVPHMVALFAVLLLITYVPALVTWLPRLLF